MAYLSMFDYSLIVLYFAFLVWLGFYLQKKASGSLEDYFLGGRNLPWWALGISGLGWSLDMAGTMLIASLLYILGPRGLFIEFRGGVPLGLVFVMVWTGKWHRRSGCMTGAQWQAFRFGTDMSGKAARLISAVAGIVFTIGMLAYLIKGTGLFLSTFIPLSPFWCAVIMIVLTTIYTVASGFYGVVYSDIFQAILIFIGIGIVSVVAFNKVPDGAALAQISEAVTGTKQWMSSFPQMEADMPAGYEMYHCLFMFTMFLILRNIISGLGTGNTSQYFAARNERDCGKIACLWSALLTFRWPMMMGYAILGIYLVKDMFPDMAVLTAAADIVKSNFPDVQKWQWADLLSNIANHPSAYSAEMVNSLQTLLGGNLNEKLPLIAFEGNINAEKILPSVLLYSLPMGCKGLILVTLLAASMSTFTFTVNMAAALFTKDIYQGFMRPKAEHKELISITYLFTVALVFVSFVMGYFVNSINDIWGWIVMGLCSGLAIPCVLRLYWWRFNGGGFAIGTFVGMIAAIIQKLLWPDMTEQNQFIILTIISVVATIAGTYFTKPTDRAVIENFYRKTRPFGFWGPIRDIMTPLQLADMKREHRNDLIALPFVFLWMVTMYLLPMQLMIRTYTEFTITLCLFLVSLVGIYIFWYKNLPDEKAGLNDEMFK